MKAAVYSKYGPPDVLEIKDIEKPVLKDNEVLIEVRAASVNPLDAGLIKGMPYIIRALFGLPKPRDTRLGVDVSGQAEAVGRNVTQFKPGDEIFGVSISDPRASAVKVWTPQGAFAEYVCAPESTLVVKPDNVTFRQAASVPVAALTALQGLRDKGHIQPGQKVLINGGAGGVVPLLCRSLSLSARKSQAYAVRGIWKWSDPSVRIKSLITLRRISPSAANVTT